MLKKGMTELGREDLSVIRDPVQEWDKAAAKEDEEVRTISSSLFLGGRVSAVVVVTFFFFFTNYQYCCYLSILSFERKMVTGNVEWGCNN